MTDVQFPRVVPLDSPLPPVLTAKVVEEARQCRVDLADYAHLRLDYSKECEISRKPIGQPTKKICEDVLELVGNTPMVRLNRIAAKYGLKYKSKINDVSHPTVAKCEFLAPGGSVKDRIAVQMIKESEAQGEIQPGDLLVEATSGNTGIGLAMAAAVKGYRLGITLPDKMSDEKMNMLLALGAEVIRTPTEAAWDAPESHITLATQLQASVPRCKFVDQYSNPANPRAHFFYTAEEIVEQCSGRLDAVVIGAGTGGTVTGVAARLKEVLPKCKVYAADPKGSSLALPDSLNEEGRGESYLVEGIGYDLPFPTLDRDLVDVWFKTDDQESFRFARDLIRTEGLLVGGSSGAALSVALRVAKTMKENERLVVVLPDSSRNYMTKFISDAWMIDYGMYPSPTTTLTLFKDRTAVELSSFAVAAAFTRKTPVQQAIDDDAGAGEDAVAFLVTDDDGHNHIEGVVDKKKLLTWLVQGRAKVQDPLEKVMAKKFRRAAESTLLSDVARMLEVHSFVVVELADGPRIITAKDVLGTLRFGRRHGDVFSNGL